MYEFTTFTILTQTLLGKRPRRTNEIEPTTAVYRCPPKEARKLAALTTC